MKLEQIVAAIPGAQLIQGDPATDIRGIAADSRLVQPGDLWVARKGRYADIHRFVPDAVTRGAAAILVERLEAVPESTVPAVLVPDGYIALAQAATAFYNQPSAAMRVIGVTGTEGKTTTVRLIESILSSSGLNTGMISTVNARWGGQDIDTGFHVTTPDANDVQRYLAAMRDAGTEIAVLETTSHALEQHRVHGVAYDVAVLTNLTSDHLNDHGSWEAYRDAKAHLFTLLAKSPRKPGVPKVAVLNVDDANFEWFLDHVREQGVDRILTYTMNDEPADFKATKIQTAKNGLRFVAETPLGEITLASPLLGEFNIWNILAAAAAAYSQNIPVEAIIKGVATVTTVTGRMERIDEGQDFIALIDFAHTANSLERMLESVRKLTQKRVIVVFGSAGLRDKEKRPLMGSIAGKLADLVVLTAEDPRTESAEDIIDQIAAGTLQAGRMEGRDFWRIADRGAAIKQAVDLAEPGDLVVVAGKGHEQSMCYGTTEYPWSDHEALRAALRGETISLNPDAGSTPAP